MTQNNPFRAGGGYNGPAYIQRRADLLLIHEINENRRFPFFIAPRQSGKTSLIKNIRNRLPSSLYVTVVIDLQELAPFTSSYDRFMPEFTYSLLSRLGLADCISAGPSLPYITSEIVRKIDRRIIVFIDEIDQLLSTPIKDLVLGVIRSLFNARLDNPELERIQFVLSGAADIKELISSDAGGSPFNIGENIGLDDLSLQQVITMATQFQVLDIEVPVEVAQRIFYYTGGSVYLTQLFMETLWENLKGRNATFISAEDVDHIFQYIVHTSNRIPHFVSIYNHLLSRPDELRAFHEYVKTGTLNKQIGDYLKSLGIVGIGKAYRNPIYEEVFGPKSFQLVTPGDDLITHLFSRITPTGELDGHGLNIQTLPREIGKLVILTNLNLSNNHLRNLPHEIGQLSKLTTLDLSNNRLTEIPKEIVQLTNLKRLDLRGNQLSIPTEILDKPDEPSAIFNYILQNQAQHKHRLQNQVELKHQLNESKVLVVGQGAVGKTSLIKRLIDNAYNPLENTTKGIDIRQWVVDVGGGIVRLNVWDFGGQEIMHATHQFFLTERSLYLLVLDSRQGEAENRLEYWLKIIQSFGSDSPILIVCNKADQHHLELDKHGLQEKYANIKGFLETSCVIGIGIPELKEAVTQQIDRLDYIHDELPLTWFAVKEHLENLTQNYITALDYYEICQANRVEDALSQRILLRFLRDLGTILNYDDDPILEDTYILNPEWVTDSVYEILNSPQMLETKGRLRRRMLNQILDKQTYPAVKHEFILEIMRKFELCFDIDDSSNEQIFLIPDLLRKEEIYTGEWEDTLAFRYQYDVLPGSIISRFMVRMNRYILQNTCWRTGVLLSYKDTEALVKADLEDRRIDVWIRKGNARTRRNLLAIIRQNFKIIHGTITGIKIQERVPVPGQSRIDVDYKHLLLMEERREQTFYPEGATEPVNVRDMLDGVAPIEERLQQREGYKRDDNFRLRPEAKRQEEEPKLPVTPQPEPTAIVPAAPTFDHQSLQVAVKSLLTVFVVVMLTAVFVSRFVEKSLLPAVLIGGVLLFILLSAGVLLLIEKLTGQEFMTLVTAVLQKVSLLAGRQTPEKVISGDPADAKGMAALKGEAKPKALPPATTPKQEADNAQKAVVAVQEPEAAKTTRTKKNHTL